MEYWPVLGSAVSTRVEYPQPGEGFTIPAALTVEPARTTYLGVGTGQEIEQDALTRNDRELISQPQPSGQFAPYISAIQINP